MHHRHSEDDSDAARAACHDGSDGGAVPLHLPRHLHLHEGAEGGESRGGSLALRIRVNAFVLQGQEQSQSRNNSLPATPTVKLALNGNVCCILATFTEARLFSPSTTTTSLRRRRTAPVLGWSRRASPRITPLPRHRSWPTSRSTWRHHRCRRRSRIGRWSPSRCPSSIGPTSHSSRDASTSPSRRF